MNNGTLQQEVARLNEKSLSLIPKGTPIVRTTGMPIVRLTSVPLLMLSMGVSNVKW